MDNLSNVVFINENLESFTFIELKEHLDDFSLKSFEQNIDNISIANVNSSFILFSNLDITTSSNNQINILSRKKTRCFVIVENWKNIKYNLSIEENQLGGFPSTNEILFLEDDEADCYFKNNTKKTITFYNINNKISEF